ncbi:GumC family protein [Trinickia acidisoli]|uniref:GumC family protein n=1 Tax=Trinickia acidisoli TaxID=2767482 RepID=UPI001A90822F|nr:Wzz/FepE/Etk N-terminal domain-containing protein [Trinickia acidisoli]
MNDMATNVTTAQRDGDPAKRGDGPGVDTPGVEEIDLLDVGIALGEEKRTIFGVAFVVTLVGLVVSLMLPAMYTGQTVLMPPQQQSSASSALAGLGALAGMAGVVPDIKSPDQVYVGLLKSDTIADRLIDRFKLEQRYDVGLMQAARTKLQERVDIAADSHSGFVTIKASDRSPVFAAQLANAYVDELRMMLDRLAVTEAQQRRLFFQQQVDKTKEKLSQAEIALKDAQRSSGVVSLDAQVLGAIRQSADLRAQIASREVELESMRTYATASNPDVQRVLAEIDAMRGQLATLEGGDGANASKKSDDAAALATVRAYREVKYQEAQLDAFTKQLELAQLDVAREGPLVQQIDVATPPEKRSAPRRGLIVLVSAVAGLALGLVAAFFRRVARSSAETAEKFVRMREAWGLRGKKARASREGVL